MRTYFLMVLALALPSVGSKTHAMDDSKSTKDSTPSYLTVGDIVGEITKLDNPGRGTGSITIRVTWNTSTPAKGSHNSSGSWSQGSVSRNPEQMAQHQMRMQQQLAKNLSRAKNKENHHDYVLEFAVDAVARVKHLPPKLDENNKKTTYTPEELQKLKGNPYVPGYTADIKDLKVGQLVEAHLVRVSGAPKEKKDELFVRWALILNEAHAKNAPNKKDTAK